MGEDVKDPVLDWNQQTLGQELAGQTSLQPEESTLTILFRARALSQT